LWSSGLFDMITTTTAEKQAIKTAAKRYMDLRKPRVQAILDFSRRMQKAKRTMTVIEEYLMYCAFWIFGERSSAPSLQNEKSHVNLVSKLQADSLV
jgi:hypothetical protein